MIPRRRFIQLAGTTLAALPVSVDFSPNTLRAEKNWGIQLFTIPQMASKDIKGTLKTLGEIGYKEVEFLAHTNSAPTKPKKVGKLLPAS